MKIYETSSRTLSILDGCPSGLADVINRSNIDIQDIVSCVILARRHFLRLSCVYKKWLKTDHAIRHEMIE